MYFPKKINYNSPVILSFTLLSFISLIIGYLTGFKSTEFLFMNYMSNFSDPLFYIRLFTHILGHANYPHFINNFLLILILGPMLEEKYGSKNLLIMIIFTAFLTALINLVFFNKALLGASGIVFMMILLSSFTNIQKDSIPLTFLLVFALYIGQEIFLGLFKNDQIAQFAHIAGGLCGSFFGYYLSKINKLV